MGGRRLLISLDISFNDPATSGIYGLSLHDALPLWSPIVDFFGEYLSKERIRRERKSTMQNR